MIIKNLNILKNIYLKTPNNFSVLTLTVFSSLLTLSGIPLLLPAINILTQKDNFNNEKLFIFYEKIYEILGIELTFNNAILFSLLLIFLGHLITLFVELFSQRIQVKLINQYTINFLEGYYKSNWIHMNDEKSGNLHSGISRESNIVSETHLDTLRFISTFLYLLTYMLISFIIFPKFILFIIFYALFTSLPILIVTKKIKDLSEKNNNKQIELSSLISNLINNKKFFKSSNNFFNFKEILKNKINFIIKTNWKSIFMDGILRTFNILLGMTLLVLVLIFHKQLNLQISEILVLLFVFSRTVPTYISFANNFTRVFQKIPIYLSLTSRQKLLKSNEEIFGEKVYKSDSIIKFDKVNFWYNVEQNNIFNDVSFSINPKTSIAILGSSGSGKSTLIDLLLGLLSPKKGNIFYGDLNNKDINYSTLREKVSYVSQNSTLVDGTINFNMRLLKNNESEENIIKACKLASIHDTIMKFPENYNYNIGENGSKLSGGQRQRLTIARSLLNDPEILILDEATNQLDKETEISINQTLLSLRGLKTIIIISHKIENFENIDFVYKIQNTTLIKVK
tara:strand:- start:56 stop:1756 length:1701 start_codon:yes stop_codon:yes gene_type:complete